MVGGREGVSCRCCDRHCNVTAVRSRGWEGLWASQVELDKQGVWRMGRRPGSRRQRGLGTEGPQRRAHQDVQRALRALLVLFDGGEHGQHEAGEDKQEPEDGGGGEAASAGSQPGGGGSGARPKAWTRRPPPALPGPHLSDQWGQPLLWESPQKAQGQRTGCVSCSAGKVGIETTPAFRRQVALHTHLSQLCPLQAEAALLSPYQD